MSILLSGITWDHERGYSPLEAVSDLFHKQNPDIAVCWKRRSLKDFGDFPLSKLIPDYDLVILDHPFTGEALSAGLLHPLNSLLDAEHLALQRRESLGPCFSSYVQKDQVMALPVDAAALVSAVQQGLVSRTPQGGDGALPKSWIEMLEFCRELGQHAVCLPLCTVDIWCVYLTLSAQTLDPACSDFFSERGVDKEKSTEALEKLYELVSYVNPCSFAMNPIKLLNAVSEGDEILYAPFIFSYTNYSRSGYRPHLIEFFDAPLLPGSRYSTLLGGAGIGISSQSRYPQEAAAFVSLLTSPEVQQGIYTRAGGQPAQKGAWLSAENNALCRDFFVNTRSTLERAYVRPRVPGFNLFQEKASLYLHEAVRRSQDPKEITDRINDCFQKTIGEIEWRN